VYCRNTSSYVQQQSPIDHVSLSVEKFNICNIIFFIFNRSSKEVLVVGDLNHFGGWRCQFCLDSPEDILMEAQKSKDKNWNLQGKKIDAEYVSDLIGQGLWVDGKLQLVRASPSRDQDYFAPETVRTGHFGHLLHNFYEKLED
jgi:hypothetical protein